VTHEDLPQIAERLLASTIAIYHKSQKFRSTISSLNILATATNYNQDFSKCILLTIFLMSINIYLQVVVYPI